MIKNAFLYLTVFITGASILALEVLGTRVIGPFFGTTIFVWTSLIIVTLGALALGYYIGGYVADKKPSLTILYPIIFTSGLLYFIPMKVDQWVLPFTDKFGLQYGPLVASIILFALPLLLLGMVSPFIIRLTTVTADKSGSSSGKVFAIGTAGSIFGGFMAGFYLIERLSITQILFYIGLVLVILAIVGILINKKISGLIPGAVMILLTTAVYNITPYVYADNYTLQIIHHEQSAYADLKIIEIAGYRCLLMNGSTQSCIYINDNSPVFGSTMDMAKIVLNHIEKNKIAEPNVLLLGLGAGDLSEALPVEINLDIVEIDKKVVDLAREYFKNNKLSNRNVFVDDARYFMSHTNTKYDIIISDLALGNSLPAHLYSKEAMELFKSNLKDDGVAIFHITAYNNQNDKFLNSILSTANEVFPVVISTAPFIDDHEEVQNFLIHLSNSKDYVYTPHDDSLFIDTKQDHNPNSLVMIDSKNLLDIYTLDQLFDYRQVMVNTGGLRMLFSL